MRDRAQVAIFAQGDVSCAVCAPEGTPSDFLVGLVEAMNPTASGPGWGVFAAELPDGGGNPRPCPHQAGRRHWLLVRGAQPASQPEPWSKDDSADACQGAPAPKRSGTETDDGRRLITRG